MNGISGGYRINFFNLPIDGQNSLKLNEYIILVNFLILKFDLIFQNITF